MLTLLVEIAFASELICPGVVPLVDGAAGDTEAWRADTSEVLDRVPGNWALGPFQAENPTSKYQAIVDQLSIEAGISPPEVRRDDRPTVNAYASLEFDALGVPHRVVGFNEEFIGKLERIAGLDAVAAVFAHEIGHHLEGHEASFTSGGLEKRRHNHEQELAADRIAGRLLADTGLGLTATDEWMSFVVWHGELDASRSYFTHPSFESRQRVISSSYRDRMKQNDWPTASATIGSGDGGTFRVESYPLQGGGNFSIAANDLNWACDLRLDVRARNGRIEGRAVPGSTDMVVRKGRTVTVRTYGGLTACHLGSVNENLGVLIARDKDGRETRHQISWDGPDKVKLRLKGRRSRPQRPSVRHLTHYPCRHTQLVQD